MLLGTPPPFCTEASSRHCTCPADSVAHTTRLPGAPPVMGPPDPFPRGTVNATRKWAARKGGHTHFPRTSSAGAHAMLTHHFSHRTPIQRSCNYECPDKDDEAVSPARSPSEPRAPCSFTGGTAVGPAPGEEDAPPFLSERRLMAQSSK